MPLFGKFLDTRFRETGRSDDFLKIDVLDRSGVRDGARDYHHVGDSGLEVIAEHIRYPFMPYMCRFGEIHSYVPYRPGFHASLVFIGRLQTKSSKIWRRPTEVDVPLDRNDED
ncbi:hypothetical protein OG809_33195 [Kribbella soli]